MSMKMNKQLLPTWTNLKYWPTESEHEKCIPYYSTYIVPRIGILKHVFKRYCVKAQFAKQLLLEKLGVVTFRMVRGITVREWFRAFLEYWHCSVLGLSQGYTVAYFGSSLKCTPLPLLCFIIRLLFSKFLIRTADNH